MTGGLAAQAQAQTMPAPALMAQGGVLSLRAETMLIPQEDGSTQRVKVAMLRAQVSGLIGVDCPMTVENVDVLIDALRKVKGEIRGSGLVVASPSTWPKDGANGRG